jgi:hypothetical protein
MVSGYAPVHTVCPSPYSEINSFFIKLVITPNWRRNCRWELKWFLCIWEKTHTRSIPNYLPARISCTVCSFLNKSHLLAKIVNRLLSMVFFGSAFLEFRGIWNFIRNWLRVIPLNFLLYNTVKFRRIPCSFVHTEFRLPLNENSCIKTKEKYKRNGIWAEFHGIPLMFMYAEFRISSNVVCAQLFKK